MQSGQAIREAITLEREKEMEFNTIMQALLGDIAMQLRPTVAEMVRQELANTQGDKVLGNIAANIDLSQLTEYLSEAQLAYVAEHLSDMQLVTVAQNVSSSDVASELSSSQLSDIAGELDADTIMQNFDLDDALREFFSDNTFSIRP